jgi:hypothetical protein
LDLRAELEGDIEYWISVWGPVCAVAAYHEGRADAWDLLASLVDAGFHDLDPVADLFVDSFATEPDWPGLLARMEANRPPPPIEITEWPCAALTGYLGLDRLGADGEARLADRLPPPVETAQATALATLAWVTSRWRHSGTHHAPGRDANIVLDLIAQGQRFACREYTIVLTQALNALHIPARPLGLYREGYHSGMGTGHAVTEAWLDDLGRWVVLDGQNGATWRDASGNLLGVGELQQMLTRNGHPAFVGSGPNFEAETAEAWMTYFRYCSAGGAAWRPDSFVPFEEGRTVVEARPLLKDPAAAYPDLAAISTSIVDHEGIPAAVFGTYHPFATGFLVVDDASLNQVLALDEPLPLDGEPSAYTRTVAVQTDYATLRASTLGYTIH